MAKKPAPLVLLPGLICNERIWDAQVAGLSEFSPFAFPGYDGAGTIEAMAERVLAAAPPVMSLAGHSMGARVALEVFRAAPERVERIALLDTGVHAAKPGEREKRYALVKLGREKGMEALVDAWLPPMVHPVRRDDPEFMTPLREMCMAADVDLFERQVKALLARPDATPLLASIVCPALAGVGRQDEWSPPSRHEPIAAAIPHATYAIFEDCGHMAPAEAPDQVNAALKDWLQTPA